MLSINKLKTKSLEILKTEAFFGSLYVWDIKDITEKLGYKKSSYAYINHALNVLHDEKRVKKHYLRKFVMSRGKQPIYWSIN